MRFEDKVAVVTGAAQGIGEAYARGLAAEGAAVVVSDSALDRAEADWDRRCALGVVIAAANYPEEQRKGDRITGLPAPADDCRVFHAGTKLEGGSVTTNGGRVLSVTALGESLEEARERAYAACSQISFEGMQFRRDIAARAAVAG